MSELTIIPMSTETERERYLSLRARARPHATWTMDDLLHQLELSASRHHDYVLVMRDGVDVAAGCSYLSPYTDDTPSLFVFFDAPDGPDLVEACDLLMHRFSTNARELGRDSLFTFVTGDGTPLVSWVEAAGFERKMRFIDVGVNPQTLELPADVSLPDGVHLRRLEQTDAELRALHAMVGEASADMPMSMSFSLPPFEEWVKTTVARTGCRPDLWTLAVTDAGEIVGVAELAAENGRPTVLWHDFTGVARAWRGRGIATALKVASIEAARADGCELLMTDNAEDNAPMRAINQRFGYEQVTVGHEYIAPVTPA